MTIAEHVSGYPYYICLVCPNCPIYPPLRSVFHIPAPAWCVPYTRPCWCPSVSECAK